MAAAATAKATAPKKLTAAGAGRDLVIAAGKGDLETVKLLLKVPGIDVNKVSTDKKKTTALLRALRENHMEIVKELLKVPTIDVNKADNDGFTALILATARSNLEIVKLLLAFPQIDVNKATAQGQTALHYCYFTDILKQLLAVKSIDVNKVNREGLTPLMNAVRAGSVDHVKLLVAYPRIDVNASRVRKEEMLFYLASGSCFGYGGVHRIEILKILLGVPGIVLPRQMFHDAKTGKFDPEINKMILAVEPKWVPKTQSDMVHFDDIFDTTAPTNPETGLPTGAKSAAINMSTCPVCFKFATRSEACNYMKHDCSKSGGYYHIDLYNKYKNPEGNIAWCTICGRICLGHRHYMLSDPSEPVPPFAPVTATAPFADDCILEGGGGLVEKFQRFRRAREVIKKMDPSLNLEEAMNLLIEETWKAPLSMVPTMNNLTAMMAAKKFTNYPTNTFPPNVRPVPEVEVIKAIPPLPTTLRPVLVSLEEPIMNAATLEEITAILVLKHSAVHAIEMDASKETDRVGIHGFFDILKAKMDKGEIGQCWKHPECKAPLHPDEVNEALRLVSDSKTNAKTFEAFNELTKRYRRLYTNMFGEVVVPEGVAPAGATTGAQPAGGAGFRRGRQSGGGKDIVEQIRAQFQPAENAACVVRRRTNTRRRRGSKRTRRFTRRV